MNILNKINKFIKVFSLFVLCVNALYHGYSISNKKLDTFLEIWKYCEFWEEGKL